MSGPFGSAQWIYNSSTGFYPKTISGSLRFNRTDEGYLSFTPASDGNRKTWTYSTWVKRSRINDSSTLLDASVSGGVYDILYFPSTNQFRYYNNGSQPGDRLTNEKFRDTAGWYHIVLAVDTTDSTAANRIKLYINGSQITSFGLTTNFDQNDDTRINSAVEHRIGQSIQGGTANLSFGGYMAETFFIDGTAHDADAFGETKNGIWVPKNVTSSNFTMGTNGWHLTFEDDTTVEAFNTVLWEGNGGTQSVTGTGFSPDFVWIKNRDNADDHYLYDTVRGPKNFLGSNTTTAEDYSANDLISFDSDGFTVGSDGGLNRDGQSIVAWCWDAGANNTITGHSSVTYEGSGSAQDIQSLPFTPDLVWIKSSSSSSGNHHLHDSVRGQSERLIANATDAEGTNPSLETFLKNGFRVTGSGNTYNATGVEYVAWCWDAGDSDPASNSNGSITSTVKASTTNGFSIISYTGTGANATVGHGLSSAPDWVLVKDRDNSNDWIVWHSGLADGTQHLKLNANEASSANTGYWNSTAPSSSVISLGSNSKTNGASQKFIAYCWHDVTGKQKFGSYTGQGNVTLGFRPGFVLIKNITDASTDWVLYDASRNPLGGTAILRPNLSNAETTETVTITANGFTTGTGSGVGASGKTYIYMAFAGSYPDFITNVNTDGTIESRVKASDTTGHSIVSYVGTGANATVGHGLSAAPDWIIFRDRDGSNNWGIYHSALGETKSIKLNVSDAAFDEAAIFNDTAPTSTVINLGSSSLCNSSGNNMIAYCWTETTGVSKFGSYTGQPNITTGFKPAFILIKNVTDNSTDWVLWDNTRNADNGNRISRPNLANTDASETIDISNTGFTAGTGSYVGASGKTYIYIAFADTREAAFWLDSSSNNNDWQHVNIDHNDSVSDSPTDNHATMDVNANTFFAGTFTDGNLQIVPGSYTFATSAIGMTSGKYYAEVKFEANSAAQMLCGISRVQPVADGDNLGSKNGQIGYYNVNGNKLVNGATAASYGATYTVGDIIGIAVNMDDGEIEFFKNGASQGTITGAIDTSETYFFASGDYSSANNNTMVWNYGANAFTYTPPDGFVKLSTANLPNPAINNAAGEEAVDHFNTSNTWTGDGSNHSESSVGFQPDFVWLKSRSNGISHALFDSVRGVGKMLNSDNSVAEITNSQYGYLSSFDTNGHTWTVGTSDGTYGTYPSATYISWNWKAGTSFSNDASATGVGTIDSTGTVNTKAGFSIISYTGTGSNGTVAHGLGAVPEWIIFRDRDNVNDWIVYHVGLGNTHGIKLNEAQASFDEATLFNDTTPTSSVFSLGTSNLANNTAATIAYCFAPKEGYSKFGSYDDSYISDSDSETAYNRTSPFVYTGFRPAFLIIKGTSAGREWVIYDNKRTPDDGVYLRANTSAAEQTDATNHDISFLSNGFKIRGGSGDINTTNESYIYMAFADQPFKFANGGIE